MPRIVILTGSELRHDYFRKFLATRKSIEVLKTFCEVPNKGLLELAGNDQQAGNRSEHLALRDQVERDFFQLFCENVKDESNPFHLEKGKINDDSIIQEVLSLKPDIIVSYGCSIVKPPLIRLFRGRFINVHLGLSPYYRGSGTNFFPFINYEVSCVGATFMHIDEGIDTGEVIHQIRPLITSVDSIHHIGNRLIKEMAICCADIIENFDAVSRARCERSENRGRFYRKVDFTEASVEQMYKCFQEGVIAQYLSNKDSLDSQFPIYVNPALL